MFLRRVKTDRLAKAFESFGSLTPPLRPRPHQSPITARSGVRPQNLFQFPRPNDLRNRSRFTRDAFFSRQIQTPPPDVIPFAQLETDSSIDPDRLESDLFVKPDTGFV